MTIKTSKSNSSKSVLRKAWSWFWFIAWRKSLWRKILTSLVTLFLIALAGMYGIAEWYIHDHANEPLELGATFISSYAEQLGVNPQQTLNAILEPVSQGGLGMKNVRLVSYWDEVEPTKGHYDFSNLDWQFAMADKYGASVSLAIGLRQPRWPECHPPTWVAGEPTAQWEPQLNNFIAAVINRYKTNPALQSYQLENEFFMKIFGDCTNFDRSRLVNEANLVKSLDPKHPLIISRSDNWIGLPVRQPTPDEFGISIYKRVYDYHFTHRYVEYPLPPWYYAFLAGATKIVTGKDTIVHELQAEPWLQTGSIDDGDLAQQSQTFSPERLQQRISYAKDTGMKSIELWGAEYWYWLKTKHSDPGAWQVVQQAVSGTAAANSH